jgi:uncharacterized repeat protein (TIGR03803 family)
MGRLQKLYNVVNEPMLPNAVILARGTCGFPPLEGNMRSFRLASVFALIFAQGMFGQAFKTLAVFDGTNGSTPEGAFTQGANGSLYSTTYAGGGHSAGTVFKMTPAGALTTLYSFTGAGSGVGDGSGPYSAPVLATSGNFYGTTPYAGASGFYGTVYQISPSGTLTTLYSFCATGGSCTDGVKPFAGLVQGVNGQLYGTTSGGGAVSAGCPSGCGTIFSITLAGQLTTLHSFHKTDGMYPNGLVLGSDGDLYGTTYQGGASTNGGTVFKITPAGKLTTLHEFTGYPNDGAEPYAGLVQAADGNFYGTTYSGGTILDGAGTVYEITPAGVETLLFSFSGGVDGGEPAAALIQGTDGNLYSTTEYGGTNCTSNGGSGCGTIFSITTAGTLTTLYNFCPAGAPPCSDGYAPVSGLFQGTNGTFYGTTPNGGSTYMGTAYNLSTGLGRFVQLVPTTGAVGSTVTILGTGLTGATSVTFNRVSAEFKVSVSTVIKATVPTGATTGLVEVVTPTGTLKSNVEYIVR